MTTKYRKLEVHKVLFIEILLLLISYNLSAQNIDYNKIIIPDNIKPKDYVERLIQLAWQNYPENQVYFHEMEIARLGVGLSRWSWLDRIRFQVNINESTINPPDVNFGNYYYPRYNFSLNIDLGMFVSIPKETNIRLENFEIRKLNLEQRKLQLRTLVIENYQKYKIAKEVYKVESASLEDVYSIFLVNEQNFKDGELEFENYLQSKRVYNTQFINKLNAESELIIAEARLEELIGVQIEEISE